MTEKIINACEYYKICESACGGTLEDTELCSCYQLYKQLKRLEQERDELKKACEKCKLFDIEKTNRDLLERIEKLEQENKELKKQLSSTKCYLCGEGFLTPEGTELYEEKERYHSVLEEIQKTIKSYELAVDNGASVDTLYTIGKIINEVLNDN